MNNIKEKISEYNENALLADGFDDAIMGIVNQSGTGKYLVLYDSDKCIEIIVNQLKKDGVEPSESYDLHIIAVEHFEFNVSGGYVGENSPMFFTRLGEEW